MFGPKPISHATYLLNIFLMSYYVFFHSRSRVFLGMIASDSRSQIVGMDFFHSLSPILEIDFFIPFPFLSFGNVFFSFPSRPLILGMEWVFSLSRT